MGKLAHWLDRAWRLLATALSFAAFGVGGVLLGLWLSLLCLVAGRGQPRQRLARRWVQRSFAAHLRLMQALGVMSCEFRGVERLQRDGLLVLTNHPTLIDVVCLISRLPNADCVVKRAVASNVFMRGPVGAAGYVSNDHGAGLVEDCIAAIAAGSNLVIFPEGTRSVPGRALQLQRGAANIAVRGRLDITPVRIRCTPPTLSKGQKWYRVPDRKFHVVVEVGEDIPIAPFLLDEAAGRSEALAARRLTEYLTLRFPHVSAIDINNL